jgi:hypothetical protein
VGVSRKCVDFWVLSICDLFPTAGARGEGGLPAAAGGGGRVFDEISFRENFAKLATKRFSCFAKMRDEFREFRGFAKLPRLRKKRFSRNTKIAKMKKT